MKKKLIQFENYLVNLKIQNLIILFFLIIFIKVGFWYHPALWKLLTISINPFEESIFLNHQAHYLYGNFLGGYMANLLGFTSKFTFFLFHLFFSFLFNFLFIFLIFKNLDRKAAIYSLIIFLVLPVSSTVFFWVGYDSITLSILVLSIIFKSNLFLVFIFGTLLGLQHFELGLLTTLSLVVLNIYNNYYSKKSFLNLKYSISIFTGTIVGKIFLKYYFLSINLNLSSGRISYTLEAIKHFLYNSYFNLYTIMWFSLSLGWLIILKYFFFKEKNKFFILILLSLILILFIVDDQTRVYANLSFLIIISQILLNNDFLKSIKNYEISLILILWLLMPYGWVWQGVLRASMVTYDFAYFINYFFEIFNNKSINSSIIWPFKRFR